MRRSWLAAASLLLVSAAPPPAAKRVVVRVPEWTSTTGTLERMERTKSGWRTLGEPIRVTVGRGGLGFDKREGDLRTPAGTFRLLGAMGYDERPPAGTKLEYRRATPSMKCVDDPRSKFYTQVLDENSVRADWTSAEDMLRRDDVYRRVIIVDYNMTKPIPGHGSCIFLHAWRAPDAPTLGCIAMELGALESLMAWVDETTELIVLPEHEWRARRER